MAMRRGGDGNDAFQTAFFTHQTQHEDGYDVLQRTRPHQINPMSGSFLNNRTGIADQESQDFTVERLDARFDCLVENLPIWKTSPRSIAARASRRSVESLVLKVTDPNEAGFLQVDKELESIQTLCENAAHQIRRGGDCTTELDKILSQAEVVWHQAADTAASSKMLKQEQQEYPFRPGLIRSRVYSFVELSWAHLRLRPTTVEVDDAGGQDSVKLDLTRSGLGETRDVPASKWTGKSSRPTIAADSKGGRPSGCGQPIRPLHRGTICSAAIQPHAGVLNNSETEPPKSPLPWTI
ncbi:hypothetical protein H2204_011978 [Knufia peltigerae]|uniref:Uncharacterized protein n=1 Tax=Knufia peltigerae TaxID=1002370 RepID=A0AA38XU72_9EURO|nr:hypothetical protein H2204_011978 [Knufia peltigerae]